MHFEVLTTTGLAIDATLSLDSNQTMWNGTVFEAFQTAHYGLYALTLTEIPAGSGRYLRSFPEGLDQSVVYNVKYTRRQGGSPSITDQMVGGETLRPSTNVTFNVIPVSASVRCQQSGNQDINVFQNTRETVLFEGLVDGAGNDLDFTGKQLRLVTFTDGTRPTELSRVEGGDITVSGNTVAVTLSIESTKSAPLYAAYVLRNVTDSVVLLNGAFFVSPAL